MRRADRLFQIIQLIRGRRLTTAQWLSTRLGVSERTVYRDIADMQQQGVPLQGTLGLGYSLGAGFDLPPLMFTLEEAKALVITTRFAQSWLDPALAQSAQAALSRVLSVLPKADADRARATAVFVPPTSLSANEQTHLQQLRRAVEGQRRVCLHYAKADAQESERWVRPLGCFYWGKVWTLAAWCELRKEFRTFRLDRIQNLHVDEKPYATKTGQSLQQFLIAMNARGVASEWRKA